MLCLKTETKDLATYLVRNCLGRRKEMRKLIAKIILLAMLAATPTVALARGGYHGLSSKRHYEAEGAERGRTGGNPLPLLILAVFGYAAVRIYNRKD